MRWQDRRESNNVEDRRQQGGGNGGGGLPIGRQGRLILLVVVMVAGYYGVDLGPCRGSGPAEPAPASELVPGCQRSLARFSPR